MNADDFIIGADEPAATVLTCPIHGCRWQYRTIEDTLGQLAAMATIHAIAHAAVEAQEDDDDLDYEALEADLDELERTDPDVARAAEAYRQARDRIIRGEAS